MHHSGCTSRQLTPFVRDTLHAPNYLTIAGGPGRPGSMVRVPVGHMNRSCYAIDSPVTREIHPLGCTTSR